jgi:hypothetical protein
MAFGGNFGTGAILAAFEQMGSFFALFLLKKIKYQYFSEFLHQSTKSTILIA